MSRTLRHEITELPHHLDADPVFGETRARFDRFAQFWIEILVAVPQTQDPSLVVDTRDQIADIIVIDADAFRQFLGCALHTVAQAHILDRRTDRMQPGQHAHRIGIIEHQRVGTQALHILGKAQMLVGGAQKTEDATDADGIGHRLLHTVFERNLHLGPVGLAPISSPANRDSRHHAIGARQQVFAISTRDYLSRQVVPVDRPLHIVLYLAQAGFGDIA